MQPPRSQKAKPPWKPIPGTSQELALMAPVHQVLFHGARGPGKSECQLMRFRRRVGIGYGSHWKGIIFDREYKNLDDLISKARRLFSGYGDGAIFQSASSLYKWVWPTGEELLFRAIKKEAEYYNYHGQEFPYIGWNELTKFPTPRLYDMMMSCNRSSFTNEKDLADVVDADGKPVVLPPIPLETFSTTNPYGPGHGWVKRRFIDVGENGQIIRHTSQVFNPQTQEDEEIDVTQVAIFGSYRENIYLDPKYVATLEQEKDPNLRKAWLYGSWEIVAGGAFDDVWATEIHVLPRFKVPIGWRIDRSFDWGSTHPFACVWWAEANGEEITLDDGRVFAPQPGSLIAIDELYGSIEIGENKGVKWSAARVAQNIRERDETLMKHGWIVQKPWSGPADNQIRNVSESGTATIEQMMGDHGVHWTHSDKSQGSRKIGLQLARDRFEAAKLHEGPAIYIMSHCRAIRSIVPNLPRDPINMDDVDTDAEDHLWDAMRYRVLAAANRIATDLNFSFPS